MSGGTSGKRRGPPPVPEPLASPLVDAHTHLDHAEAGEPEAMHAALERAASAGVHRVVTVADGMASARWAVQAAQRDERLYAAVALHPTSAHGLGQAERRELERLVAEPRVVAVGETGLDYYWPGRMPECASVADQREAFRWHIALAKRTSTPLMIHCREAEDDVLAMLRDEGAPEKVMFHCFSGDADAAKAAVDAGYVLSFAGNVTFRNAVALQQAAQEVPADRLLVETDAPFLTPHPYRGAQNEPYCVGYTLRFLAELRGVDAAELAAQTTANAVRVFGFPAPPAAGG